MAQNDMTNVSYDQIFNLYKNKIKKLENIDSNELNIITSFNGEIVKANLFSQTINQIKLKNNNDLEILNLCRSLYPHLFEIENDKLIVSKIKIRKDGFKFTDDQKKACKKFINFFTDEKKNMFGLYGFSGTGKTTTLIEIVCYMLTYKLIKTVVFSAPTNKAVNVMKNKFEKYIRDIYCIYSGKSSEETENLLFDDVIWKLNEYNIIIEFSTIHKLLNFGSDTDINGKLCFKFNNNADIWKYDLIVIDECSMIPATMIDIIFTTIRENKTNNKNMKIVFSGDIAQLPPVNEKNSIIFSKDLSDFPFDSFLKSLELENSDYVTQSCHKAKYDRLMEEIIKMENFVMKQVVRSKSNNVLGVCNTIRDWTLGDIDKFKIGDFIDLMDCHAYRCDKYDKFRKDRSDEYKKKLSSKWFKIFTDQCQNGTDSIILTWTNDMCDAYNNEIRKILFKFHNKDKEKIERFLPGDVLMLSDFYSMKQDKDDTNKFYTSEQIKIVDLEIIEKQIGIFPLTLDKKSKKLEHSDKYEEIYKNTVHEINSSVMKTYKCWKLYVKRLSSKNDDLCILFVIHEDYEKVHETEKEFISNHIKRLRTKLVKKFKEKTSVIDNNIIKFFWKNFHAYYIQPFANVNYGYCITSHKAQGSTFYNVFVDWDDIVKNTNDNEMKRCLYTAVSRTSNELHMLI